MKALYISGVAIVLLLVIGIPVYYKYFNKAPSCYDGIQNQDELGIDCNGVCALLCPYESRDPIISFQRLYEANPGVYTALAMLENPNQGVFARKVSYVFKIYDEDNILLFEIPGTTFIPPGREFPVFASPILTGNRDAAKETFTITDSVIAWEKGEWKEPSIEVANVTNGVVAGRQRVTADIVNNEVYALRDLEVIVVAYDRSGNAMQASATVVSYISPEDKANITFTWTEPFSFEVSKVDIIPRTLPRDFSTE
jgi:hypothetical protein